MIPKPDKGICSTVLLILIIILAVASIPSATSQTFTTTATTNTTTNLVTISAYSTQTIGYTTQTVTVTSVFLDLTDIVSGTLGYCWYDNAALNIQPGTTAVTGTIGPPSSQIDFFIMTQAQFTAFQGSSCRGPRSISTYEAIVKVQSLTSTYSLNWYDPPPGSYIVVVFDEKPNQSFTVPIRIVVLNVQQETSPIYSTATNQVLMSVTQTATSTKVTQVPAEFGSSINPTLLGGIILVIGVLALVISVALKRKGKHRSKQATLSQFVKIPTSWIKCGTELPPASEFCNKCGTKQT